LGAGLVFVLDSFFSDSISDETVQLVTSYDIISSLVEQIKLYDPGYNYTHGIDWVGARFLSDLLQYEQIEYLNRFSSECSRDFDATLYNNAKLDHDARLAIYNSLYGDDSNQEELLEREYRDYRANGGELSYLDWFFVKRPSPDGSDARDKPVYNSQLIVPGTEINGVPVRDIVYGTNGKIAVIGQGMTDRDGLGRGVLDIAEELRSQYDVETFEPSTTANEEWRDMLDEIKEERGPDTRFTDVELEQLLIYAENEAWAEKLTDEGYTVIDIGNPQNNESSVFYDMEGRVIFDR